MLFVDYSSAFNTIIPKRLYHKLLNLNVPCALCDWILDFLTDRPQIVKIGCNISKSIVLSTGCPQGCVISPKLYSLNTYDCCASTDKCCVVKFTDGTTIVGFIDNCDESYYRSQIDFLIKWCNDNNLMLNVNKTKEMVIDFRLNKTAIQPITINGNVVEIVTSFRFLGTVICNNLSWNDQCIEILKKARQRLYFLRTLRSFNVNSEILLNFYNAIIEY